MVVCHCVWKGLLNVFGFLRRGASRPEMWSLIKSVFFAIVTFVIAVATFVAEALKLVDLVSKAMGVFRKAKESRYEM